MEIQINHRSAGLLKTEKPAVNKINNLKNIYFLNISIFLLILFSGSLLSLFLPKTEISVTEKRKLAQLPDFAWTYFFKGKFTNGLELYYADNFPFRESMISFSNALNENFGFVANDDIFLYNTAKAEGNSAKNQSNLPGKNKNNEAGISAKDSTKTNEEDLENTELDTLANDAEMVKSVLIYKKRAIQKFGGSKKMAGRYADMINSYHKTLGNDVKIYNLIIPTPFDFYLPEKYKGGKKPEKNHIDFVGSKLDPAITNIDAYTEIEKHKKEYLYFNTDHHWTSRGAYYAYRGFCSSAGFAPFELSDFSRGIKHKFLGSLYDLTQDSRLKENLDSVEYFRLPVVTQVLIYKNKNLKTSTKSTLLVELASGANSYSVFLGGDFPLVKVQTGNKNGRKILVIKDSYGNALAPYLALHYEELFIVDYRYFESNLPEFIKKNNITDMLFLHNTFVSNAKYTAQRESYLMKIKNKNELPAENEKKDSAATVSTK